MVAVGRATGAPKAYDGFSIAMQNQTTYLTAFKQGVVGAR